MRAVRVHRLRTPKRPNPGRKHGGAGKVVRKAADRKAKA